jgi:Tfp pilus assembly protein PilO
LKKIPVKFQLDFLTNFLNTRAPREKLTFVAFGAVFLLFLDFFFWLSPVVKTLTRTVPMLSSLSTELAELKDDKKNENAIRQKWESVHQELTEKEKGFEVSNQLPALLESLSKLAGESGVRITSLKPVEASPPMSQKLYFSVPVEIHATAGAHELGNFLSRLESEPSFFKVTNLKIMSTTTDFRRHSVEMMVETYRKV